MPAREDIFFVVGEMKSGTTWLMHLLNACDGVTCRGEDQFGILAKGMADLLNQYNQLTAQERDRYPSAANACLFSQDDLPVLVKTAVQRTVFRDVPDDQIAGSKFRSLFEHIDLFRGMFPAGKFIHIVRDPRDIAISYHHFSENFMTEAVRGQLGSLADSAKGIAQSWTRTLTIVQREKEKNPEGIFELRYEDLKTDTAGKLSEILSFLGASLPDRAVADAVEEASFSKLSGGRRAGDEDTKSFYRKGVVGDWREKMDGAILEIFENEDTKRLMTEWGYA